MKRVTMLLAFAACSLWAQEHGQEAKEAGGHEAAAQEGGHEAGGENLAAKWVNFAILAAGLGFAAVKFGGPALKSQQKQILDDLNLAATRAEAAAAQAAEIDRRVAGLPDEISAVRQKAEAELAAESVRIQADTEHGLAKLAQSAEQEVASAAKLARQQLKAEAARLALQLAEQKIQARMDAGSQGKLVDRFIGNLGAKG
jgi:F-type H+-transporting ATPase subunit b